MNRDVVENACSEMYSNDGTRPSTSSNGLIVQTRAQPGAAKSKGLAGRRHGRSLYLFTPWDYIVGSLGHNCRARKLSPYQGRSRQVNVHPAMPILRRSCLSCRTARIGHIGRRVERRDLRECACRANQAMNNVRLWHVTGSSVSSSATDWQKSSNGVLSPRLFLKRALRPTGSNGFFDWFPSPFSLRAEFNPCRTGEEFFARLL